MNSITKESSVNEIRMYFECVLKLANNAEEFPINLDEVWPLVYSRKDHAVRDLTSEFIEDVDFKVFPKNGENPNGGRPSNEYALSIPCMEFFIARKVRPVFEVYRQVFHKTANNIRSSKVDNMITWVNGVCKILNLNEVSRLSLLKKGAEQIGESLPLPEYSNSNGVAKSATELLKQYGYNLSARAFNSLAVANGYLKDNTRASRKGCKHFRTITEKGMQYGENVVSPNNPNETQPHWYENTFQTLMNKLGITKPRIIHF